MVKGSSKYGLTASELKRTRCTHTHMVARCTKLKHLKFKNYGAKGVTVCERWLEFQNFLDDMGHRPEGMTLDRFPNRNGNYEPGNCRWATAQQQAHNTDRCANGHTIGGKPTTIVEAARQLGISSGTLSARISRRNWTLEQAIAYPGRWNLPPYCKEAA